MKKTDSLLGKVLGYSLVSVISAALSLVVVPISTHIYDQNQLGVINFFFSVTTVLYSFFCLGLDQAYVRFFAIVDDQSRKGLFTLNLVTCLVVLFLAFLLSLAFQNEISNFLFGEYREYSSLFALSVIAGMIVLRFFSLYYRLNESIVGYTITAGLIAIIQKGAYLIASIYSREYIDAIVFVSLFSLLCGFVISFYKRECFGPIKFIDGREVCKKNYRYAAPLLISAMVATMIPYVPQIVVRWEMGFEAVSILTASTTVSLAINLIQSGFNAFWSPYVFKNYQSNQAKIQVVHEYIVIVSTIACVILAMVSDLVFLLFASKYYIGSTIVPLLMLSPLCYTIGETTGIGITIKLKTKYILLINVFSLLLCIILSALLIPSLRFAGAATATGLSALFCLLLKTQIGERYYQSVKSKSFMFRGLIPYIAVCVASVALPQLAIEKTLFEFLCLVIMMMLFGKNRLLNLVRAFKSFLFD